MGADENERRGALHGERSPGEGLVQTYETLAELSHRLSGEAAVERAAREVAAFGGVLRVQAVFADEIVTLVGEA